MTQSPRLSAYTVQANSATLAWMHNPYKPGCLWISSASQLTAASNQLGDAFCGGSGGDRVAGGGHVAKRIARLIHQGRHAGAWVTHGGIALHRTNDV